MPSYVPDSLKKRSPSALTLSQGWLPGQKVPMSVFFIASRPGSWSGRRALLSNWAIEWVSSIAAPTQRQARMPSPRAPGIDLLPPRMRRFQGCRASSIL